MTSTTAPPALLTIHEAAEYLRVSPRTVYAITHPRGTLRCVRVGSRGVRYTLASIQEFVRAQESCDVTTC
jgi:excisionase family DNA binding protein